MAFGIYPRFGSLRLSRVKTFLSQNLRHFYNNIHSWIKNNGCCPRTVDISNVDFTTKYLYRQSQYWTPWDSKCLALKTLMVRAFGVNPKVRSSSPPEEKKLSQNFRHFHKNIRLWVENECFCPQLTFQMVTILHKWKYTYRVRCCYIITQSSITPNIWYWIYIRSGAVILQRDPL